MKASVRNVILLVLMLAASGMAVALRPTAMLVASASKIDLGAIIPKRFGEWSEVTGNSVVVLDPQQQELISKIYSQTLSRTYVSKDGYQIMLSIAYGDDQRDSLKLHYPEVCYPAQGFQLLSNKSSELVTPTHKLPVRRLEMRLGANRSEPVTYWAVIGTIPFRGGVDKKLAEMHYGMRGIIPDGMLFRISSVDTNSDRAFAQQDAFVRDLFNAVDPATRPRVFGGQG